MPFSMITVLPRPGLHFCVDGGPSVLSNDVLGRGHDEIFDESTAVFRWGANEKRMLLEFCEKKDLPGASWAGQVKSEDGHGFPGRFRAKSPGREKGVT